MKKTNRDKYWVVDQIEMRLREKKDVLDWFLAMNYDVDELNRNYDRYIESDYFKADPIGTLCSIIEEDYEESK